MICNISTYDFSRAIDLKWCRERLIKGMDNDITYKAGFHCLPCKRGIRTREVTGLMVVLRGAESMETIRQQIMSRKSPEIYSLKPPTFA